MSNKFSNLTIDQKQLMGISIQDRVQLARSSQASDIFGNLSPTEIAKLFPTYYQKHVPNIAGFMGKGTGDFTSGFNKANRSGGSSGGGGGGGGGGSSQSTADPYVAPSVSEAIKIAADRKKDGSNYRPKYGGPAIDALKAEIARGEGDYGAYNRGKAGDTPTKARQHDITQMTVGEIMQAQAGGAGRRKMFAVGKYQFIPETFKEAVKYTGIDPNTKFDANTQERLFDYLISPAKRPKLAAYLNGRTDDIDDALDDLAREFASIPDNSGRGKYDGDSAGNSAAGGRQRAQHIKALLEQARNEIAENKKREEEEQKNPHNQTLPDGTKTDIGIVDLNAAPEGMTARITPQNITSVEGLDPRIIEHIKTLPEPEQVMFYENLNTLGDVNEINEAAKGPLERLGNYKPQGTAQPLTQDALGEDPYAFWAARNPNSAALELDGKPIDKRTMTLNMMAAKRFEADNPGKRVEIYGGKSGIRDEYSGSQHSKDKRTALDIAIFQLDDNGRKINMGGPNGGNIPNAPFGAHGTAESWKKNAHLYNQYGENVEMARVYQAEVNMNPDYKNVGVTMGEYFPRRMTGDSMHNDLRGTFGVNSETGISTSGFDPGSVAYGWNEDYLRKYGFDLNSPEGQEMRTGLAEKYPTKEAVVQAAQQMYAPVEPPPNPHVGELEDGTKTDIVPTDINSGQPLANTATPVPTEAPAMALGGFIPEKDNLEVTNKETGETVAQINEGELKGGITPEGTGLRVESNKTRLADDLVNKYEQPTANDDEDDQPTQQEAKGPTVQNTGSMTSSIEMSQSAKNIEHIPYQTGFDLIHGSLYRAFDLGTRRTTYGSS
jgi:hypothetical protein